MRTVKIFGAPGCGKTTDMLARLEQEIKAGTRLDRICFVTATVAARDVAKERARRLLPSATEKEFKYFRTIHGICFGELHLGRENVMQTEDYIAFGERACVLFSEDFTESLDDEGTPTGYAHSPGNEVLALRQLAAAWELPVSDPAVLSRCPPEISVEEVKNVLTKYAEYKRIATKFDFIDMLQKYMGDGFSPLNIDVIFVDEGQDLSRLQWSVVAKMSARAQRRYVAGDDDQSIYGFIGADPTGFFRLEADETVILPRTYRLRRNIWDFANRIIQEVQERVPKHIEVNGEGGTVDFWNLDPEYLDFEQGETMVIARHHTQLAGIARTLTLRGTPFYHNGKSIAGTDRARAVYYFIQAKQGKSIDKREAGLVVKYAAAKDQFKRFRDEARINPAGVIDGSTLAQYGVSVGAPWASQFAQNKRDFFQNEGISQILREKGPSALVEPPRIKLTTYHAAKGDEAENVILFTNCYQSAWDNAQLYPDDERRLAYVGVTRAKSRLTIVAPTSNMYMRSLV